MLCLFLTCVCVSGPVPLLAMAMAAALPMPLLAPVIMKARPAMDTSRSFSANLLEADRKAFLQDESSGFIKPVRVCVCVGHPSLLCSANTMKARECLASSLMRPQQDAFVCECVSSCGTAGPSIQPIVPGATVQGRLQGEIKGRGGRQLELNAPLCSTVSCRELLAQGRSRQLSGGQIREQRGGGKQSQKHLFRQPHDPPGVNCNTSDKTLKHLKGMKIRQGHCSHWSNCSFVILKGVFQ